MDYWNGVFSELISKKVICSFHILLSRILILPFFYYYYYLFIVAAVVLVTFYVAVVLIANVLLINVLINHQKLFPSIRYRIKLLGSSKQESIFIIRLPLTPSCWANKNIKIKKFRCLSIKLALQLFNSLVA